MRPGSVTRDVFAPFESGLTWFRDGYSVELVTRFRLFKCPIKFDIILQNSPNRVQKPFWEDSFIEIPISHSMDHCIVYDASVLFAVISGTSATLLSLLLWSVFRQSPIGKILFGFLFVMSMFTVQNGLVLLFSCEVVLVRLFKSGINTMILLFVTYLLVTANTLEGNLIGGERP